MKKIISKLMLLFFILNLFPIFSTEKVYAEAISYKEFVQNAINSANEKGLYVSVMLAQYFLESGAQVSGDSISLSGLASPPNYNLFGIKCGGRTNCVVMQTAEDDGYGNLSIINDSFRRYNSHQESFSDNAELLVTKTGKNPKIASGELKGDPDYLYSCAWKEYAESYQEATSCLQGTYATDTSYSQKLNNIIESRGLTEYDSESSVTTNKDGSTSKPSTKYEGEDAWKNKMVNFVNEKYASNFSGISNGRTSFINNAFISGMNKTSAKLLSWAYIFLLFITTGVFFLMFTATIYYLVILPNGLGGQKLANTFTKVTRIEAFNSRKNTLDLLSRLGISTVFIACLYANLIPVFASTMISIIQALLNAI